METQWGCVAGVWPIRYLNYHPYAKKNIVAHLPAAQSVWRMVVAQFFPPILWAS
jgi:hypothetical protein